MIPRRLEHRCVECSFAEEPIVHLLLDGTAVRAQIAEGIAG
jgi:hypothetical protein